MALPTPKGKITHADIPTLIGQAIVVRSNSDNSEKRGVIGSYDNTKNMARVDVGRSNFWVNTVNQATEYVYMQ
jgi:hypothetical protein